MTNFVIAAARMGSVPQGTFARAWTLGQTGTAARGDQTGTC